MKYENFEIEGIPAEWVSVDRRHMKKYVILYCHGGGYNTGSFRYARSVTNKLASTTSMDVLSFDYRLAPECPYPAALEDAVKVWDHLMHCLLYTSIEITDSGKGMDEQQIALLKRKVSGEIEVSGGSGNGIGLKNVRCV